MHRFAMIVTCLLAVGCGGLEQRQPVVPAVPESAKEARSAVVAREEAGEPAPYVIESAKPDAERRTLMVRREIRYGELALLLGITVEALNKLNGLSLDADTLLAAGSELYVPGLSPWA